MTRDEFKKLMQTVTAMFPKEKVKFSNESAQVWYEALKELEYDRAYKGLMKYAKESEWFPSIADFYKNAPPKRLSTISEEEMQRIAEAHSGADKW